MENNSKVNQFIKDLLLLDKDKGKIVDILRKKVLKAAPNTKEEIKYGGLVFMVGAKLICGIFIRKNHISVEFSFGMMMQDSDNFLEGDGKYRKHLKIFQQKDIKNKKVEYYIKQSFKL